MAQPTTRSEFKEWCLRNLGKPVIEINVDDDQVEDRIDEALAYYRDYHFDGSQKLYLKHQITETDKTNGYISVSNTINGVIDIFDIGDALSQNNMFGIKYQFALNHIHELAHYQLTHYFMAMQHLQFLEELLVGKQPIRYNRHVNRLYIDTDWEGLVVGNYIIAVVYEVLDPDIYPDVWTDRWLQKYATQKIKYQWGSNLTKFSGMQLPGGVQFNGEKIMDDALTEINKLEEEMNTSYGLPVHDLFG